MKITQTLAVFLGSVLSTYAGMVHFDLSPPGTDVAVGLSPSNQVPAVTNSTGSGGTISGGIVFDTDSMILQVAVGYGSAAGFTDLTGVPVAMHIHSPAAAGQNASPLVDLSPYNFTAPNPTNGGVIFGNIAFPINSVSNLLAGVTYINIHTALNPGGEIRGQLIPQEVPESNSPPVLVCPQDSTNQCGSPALVTAQVSDPDGDALTVVWTVNGSAAQTNTLPAHSPPQTNMVAFMADLSLGTNTVDITVTDSATNTTSCTSTVTVADTIPPVIASASASPNVLWPPNHRWVDVVVRANVSDACGATTWQIISVSSNESGNRNGNNGNGNGNGNGHGHGNGNGNGNGGGNNNGQTGEEWQITGPHTVKLLAERNGNGHGRVYSITIQAQDAAGNVSLTKVVTVTVPHDQGHR
jgi:hypothetical protein